MTFPAESLVGKFVYIRRTKREAGALNSGTVTRVDEHGRIIIETRIGVLALSMGDVTENIDEA